MSELWSVPGYTQVRELGRGGTGTVVLATAESGAHVAIKYLNPELAVDEGFRAAFRAEAQQLAELDSPNLVRLHEYVESDRGAAIVMEAVEGASARSVLAAQGPTEPEASLSMLKGWLLGLGAAHGAGVVHRDFKPANVLVTADGESKLVDFGVSVRAGGASGTPAYMPPEQWAGGAASPRGDIYSATATFFECVTGRPPFPGFDVATLRALHTWAPVPATKLPEPLQGLARRGMAKNPAERPVDAAAFLVDLDRAAVAGYGQDWEERGRHSLARRAALLALVLPAAVPAAAERTASASTVPLVASTVPWVRPTVPRILPTVSPTVVHGAGRGRRTAILAGVGAAILIGGVVTAVIIRGEAPGVSLPSTDGSAGAPVASVPAVVAPVPALAPAVTDPTPSLGGASGTVVVPAAVAAPAVTPAVSGSGGPGVVGSASSSGAGASGSGGPGGGAGSSAGAGSGGSGGAGSGSSSGGGDNGSLISAEAGPLRISAGSNSNSDGDSNSNSDGDSNSNSSSGGGGDDSGGGGGDSGGGVDIGPVSIDLG